MTWLTVLSLCLLCLGIGIGIGIGQHRGRREADGRLVIQLDNCRAQRISTEQCLAGALRELRALRRGEACRCGRERT